MYVWAWYICCLFFYPKVHICIYFLQFFITRIFYRWLILPRTLDDPWIGGTVPKVAAWEEFLVNPVYIFGSAISDVLHVLSSPVSGSCILLLVDCCLLIIGTLAANLTAFPMLPSDINHQFPTNIDKVAFQVGNMGNSIRAQHSTVTKVQSHHFLIEDSWYILQQVLHKHKLGLSSNRKLFR